MYLLRYVCIFSCNLWGWKYGDTWNNLLFYISSLLLYCYGQIIYYYELFFYAYCVMCAWYSCNIFGCWEYINMEITIFHRRQCGLLRYMYSMLNGAIFLRGKKMILEIFIVLIVIYCVIYCNILSSRFVVVKNHGFVIANFFYCA